MFLESYSHLLGYLSLHLRLNLLLFVALILPSLTLLLVVAFSIFLMTSLYLSVEMVITGQHCLVILHLLFQLDRYRCLLIQLSHPSLVFFSASFLLQKSTSVGMVLVKSL